MANSNDTLLVITGAFFPKALPMSNDETGPNEHPLNAAEFLCRVLGELGSSIGAIWVGDDGQLVPVLTIGLEDTQLFEGVEGKQFLQQILADTLTQGRAQTFDTDGLIEPKEYGHATLFVSPILIPNARPGVILVIERPNLPQQQRQGIMRHIESRCRELSRSLAVQVPPQYETEPEIPTISDPSDSPVFSSSPSISIPSISAPSMTATAPQISMVSPSVTSTAASKSAIDSHAVLEYVLSLQRSLDLNEVSNVIVNDGRVLFEADRVSLALMRGKKAVIKAVSGQESVHPRGNLIRTMRLLTQKALATDEPFRFDGSLNTVPKQLEEPLAEFIQEAGTRFLLIVPLIEPERLIKPEEPMGGGKPHKIVRKTIGALIIEQMSSSEPSKQLKNVLDSVVDHIAAATFNARNHSSIFLLPLWRALGRFVEWLRGRRLAIACAIFVLLAAAGTALVMVPWEYRVEGKGTLMPVIQREVFAPWDGHVVDLLVEGGDHVEEGQELIRLRNDDLEADLVKFQAQVDEKKKQLHSLYNQSYEVKNKPEEKARVEGKIIETKVEMEGYESHLKLLKERQNKLNVRAPIAGIVTTFQVQQLLLNRPVKRGDVLVQVMDEKGDWQLELEIEEHRVGRILRAQKALTANLPIDYRLLTSPEKSYAATLGFLATRTVAAEEKGSVLEARATLDKSKLPQMTIGAEVRARIGCGQSYLGDVLFGDVIEFVQKYLWW